jgi:hypothetical protein
MAASPESIVQAWLGANSAAIDAAIFSEPFYIPFERLANIDGWVVWLGHPPVPDGLPLLPGPEHLLWGDPVQAIATSLLVAADYASRRGAADAAAAILRRESPIAFLVPDQLHHSVESVLYAAESAGIPVLRGHDLSADALRGAAPPFATRSALHQVNMGRKHDPAFSFQERTRQFSIGANSLSCFFIHNRGERDAIEISGDISEIVGIEIGLPPDFSPNNLAGFEHEVAIIPSFLDGISSRSYFDSLEIGWDGNEWPRASEIGEVFSLYLKSLFGASFVDVQIVFVAPRGDTALLSAMRAKEIKSQRAFSD